jgi:hypothetical protein
MPELTPEPDSTGGESPKKTQALKDKKLAILNPFFKLPLQLRYHRFS